LDRRNDRREKIGQTAVEHDHVGALFVDKRADFEGGLGAKRAQPMPGESSGDFGENADIIVDEKDSDRALVEHSFPVLRLAPREP
jgi:hypothetical protein